MTRKAKYINANVRIISVPNGLWVVQTPDLSHPVWDNGEPMRLKERDPWLTINSPCEYSVALAHPVVVAAQ